MNNPTLPLLDEPTLTALRKAVALHGHKAKSAIRAAWSNGGYNSVGLVDFDTQLQRLRNTHGRSWLHVTNLKRLLASNTSTAMSNERATEFLAAHGLEWCESDNDSDFPGLKEFGIYGEGYSGTVDGLNIGDALASERWPDLLESLKLEGR